MSADLQAPQRAAVEAFCVGIGSNPLLVQGAGGNVSWKTGSTLWIKASGTALRDASAQDIFVPVDVQEIRHAVDERRFDVQPSVVGSHLLRPSIETLLHALMPHPVVAHLHMVNVLAYLVREDASELMRLASMSGLNFGFVAYYKPGEELAKAVHRLPLERIDVVFLGNHGVVVGASNVDELRKRIAQLDAAFAGVSIPGPRPTLIPPFSPNPAYQPIADNRLHGLAKDPDLAHRVTNDWALYPDHLVFLGARAVLVEEVADLAQMTTAPIVFVAGAGTYVSNAVTAAQLEQLACYFDVISRVPRSARLRSLSHIEVAQLLDWDAEKYRQSLSMR